MFWIPYFLRIRNTKKIRNSVETAEIWGTSNTMDSIMVVMPKSTAVENEAT